MAGRQFGNLTRKVILDELLRLGLIHSRKTAKKKIAKPAKPAKHWGFSIKRAMKPSKAFRTSRTAFKPSFRKYLRG